MAHWGAVSVTPLSGVAPFLVNLLRIESFGRPQVVRLKKFCNAQEGLILTRLKPPFHELFEGPLVCSSLGLLSAMKTSFLVVQAGKC